MKRIAALLLCALLTLSLAATGDLRYPIYFYILNLLMIITELVLYFRNRKLDAAREKGESK